MLRLLRISRALAISLVKSISWLFSFRQMLSMSIWGRAAI
jgi:hypothetical protein